MNRGNEDDIYRTNVELVEHLVAALDQTKRPPHVTFISSIHHGSDSAYGRSKREGERLLRDWAERNDASLSILVVPNVFGPGCRPFYNSVVATFCHQLARGEEATVIEDRELELIDIDRLCREIERTVKNPTNGIEVRRVEGNGRITTAALLRILEGFRHFFFDRDVVPDLSDAFQSALYCTFLSYIEPENHRHRPELKGDDRGQLFEIIRTSGGGQVMFSTTKPGVIRGNHYHRRKIEWFCVVRGEAAIRMRRLGEERIDEFRVTGEAPEFLSIPPLYTHHIENTGADELLTMFWCNEIFNPADPDTFIESVYPAGTET